MNPTSIWYRHGFSVLLLGMLLAPLILLGGCSPKPKASPLSVQTPAPSPSVKEKDAGDNKTETSYLGRMGDVPIQLNLETTDSEVSAVVKVGNAPDSKSLIGKWEKASVGRLARFQMEEGVSLLILEQAGKPLFGYQQRGEQLTPLYGISRGNSTLLPQEINEADRYFKGNWQGLSNKAEKGSGLTWTPLYRGVAYFELKGWLGKSTGVVTGLAIENEEGFQGVLSLGPDEKKAPVMKFVMKGDTLYLKSNDYHYQCPKGVVYDTIYLMKQESVQKPTPLSVGVATNPEAEKRFLNLVGSYWGRFAKYTTGVDYQTVVLDGQPCQAGNSISPVGNGSCFYAYTDNYWYAAVVDGEETLYFTEDPDYADHLPKVFQLWQESPFKKPGEVHLQSILKTRRP